jgi:hypothetical protein
LASSVEQTRTWTQTASLFKILNHQPQLENCLTFSLLSRYLTYQFHSVNPKREHFSEMQAKQAISPKSKIFWLAMDQELGSLNREARKLEKIIHHNVLKLKEEK